jgi:hypothetical protein
MTDKHTPEEPMCHCQFEEHADPRRELPSFIFCPLHAAAPKLLEALKEWSLPYIDYVGFIDSNIAKRLERTRAAIDAAKGDA